MRVRAPLMPDVAFVELPPKKPVQIVGLTLGRDICRRSEHHIEASLLTLLVEDDNVATSEVDGVSGTKTRDWGQRQLSAV